VLVSAAMEAAAIDWPSARVSPKFMVIAFTPARSTPALRNTPTALVPSSESPVVTTGSVSQTARLRPLAR